jgi:hypothetical protein
LKRNKIQLSKQKNIYIYLREAITRNSKTGSACIVYVIGEGSIIFESSESKKWNSWQVDFEEKF